MKRHTQRLRICSPGISRAQKIRGLGQRISKLKALYAEAGSILRVLLIDPSAAVVRTLCRRFHVLQVHFSICFQEAQLLAISVIESLGARRPVHLVAPR
jgi:hypothetical protein